MTPLVHAVLIVVGVVIVVKVLPALFWDLFSYEPEEPVR